MRPMSLVRPIDHQHQHQREADHRRPLHHPQRDRPAAQFLDQAQKMWPPSSGRIGSRLIRPSERLTRASSSSDWYDADVDRLVGDVADADDAGDLLALFRFEDAGEDRGGFLGRPARSSRRLRVAAAPTPMLAVFAAVGEADQGPLARPVVLGAGPRSSAPAPSRRIRQLHRGRRHAAVDLLAGAFVRGRPACRTVRQALFAVEAREATCRRRRRSGRPAAAPSPPASPA